MKRVLQAIGAAALGLAAVLLLTTSPSAAYTLTFTGTTTAASGAFDALGVQVGDPITGTLTFNPFVTSPTTHTTENSFHQPSSTFSLNVSNSTLDLTSSGSGPGSVVTAGGSHQHLTFQASKLAPAPKLLSLFFVTDMPGLAVGDLTGLPSTPEDIISFLGGHLLAASGTLQTGSSSNDLLSFDLTVSKAPIPAGLPLFATALGGLGILGWRRKRATSAL